VTRIRQVLPEDLAPDRVDKVLAAFLPGTTRETVKRWIGEGRVLVGGQPCRPKDRVGPGAVLEVEPGPEPLSDAQPDPSVALDVVYEDAELLVVNKAAGVVVHPARGHATGTLVNGLLARPGFSPATADPLDAVGHLRPGIVHRIDRDTSGLLVVAKTPAAREGLKRQLAEHSVARRYLAITVGVPRDGRIETLHGRDPTSRLRFTSRVAEGKRAVTKVSVRELLAGGAAALVACELETGRTHQIRVHLSVERRTPILADQLYGGLSGAPRVQAVARALGRQALHAELLGFVHPLTGQELRFEAPLPADLDAALQQLREAQSEQTE
jgi:23S rRNA pseudouridine1911/1915/1917 synthase